MAPVLLLILAAGTIFVYLSAYRRGVLPGAEGSRSRPKPCAGREKQRALGLTQLWSRDRNLKGSTIDIIAIHGLDTQSPTTWKAYRNRRDDTDGHVHWLSDVDMLHARFPEASIYTYDWLSATYSNAVQDGLRGHADTLLDEIKNRPSPGRHLVFIASCFGGLLLAKAMTLAYSKQRTPNGLLEDTRGIVFLGTPFRKSDAGNAAQMRAQVAKLMGGESSDELIKYLTKNDKAMSEMLEDFEKIVLRNNPQIQLICYYETKETQIFSAIFPRWITRLLPRGTLVLVPRESVDIAGSELRAIHVKHALLNKFFGPDDKNFQSVCEGLRDLFEQAKQYDIHHLLEKYYGEDDGGRRLFIERLSVKRLPMDRCYINLCIIEHDRGRDHDTDTDSRISQFSLSSRLKIQTPPKTKQVILQSLFEPRELPDGMTAPPKRVLIWGRAGVGKSTLCKKMVHDFIYEGLWKDLFDYVFWIPLRELKDLSSENLEDMLLRKFFRNADRGLLRGQLRKIPSSRILLILDGMDEVSYTFDPNEHRGQILQELLQYDHTIVTSRPHSTNAFTSTLPDLELETIGFFPAQVNEYLEAAEEQTPETRFSIRSFIQKHPIVGSLVRIPIQLDALCYCWGGTFTPTDTTTMTTLYRDIETKLWEKYITLRDHSITSSQVQGAVAIEEAVKGEITFLGKLGFSGLLNEIVEFDARHLSKALTGQDPMFNHSLVHNSFLRSSGNSMKPERQSYHFIHLTFQEYFAARYFVHHWTSEKEIPLSRDPKGRRSLDTGEKISPQDFLFREKYSARYDIFWRFVVGLLQEGDNNSLEQFFEALENEPRDLLGPSHQRLIIHCLNEVYSSDDQLKFQARLTDQYLQWILFEYHVTSGSILGSETECPDRVFVSLLQGSLEERQISIEALRHRLNVSPEVLTMVLGELRRTSDSRIRQAAYQILGANCHQTSGQQFVDFWQNLHQSRLADRKEAVNGLRYCPSQHLAIRALVQLLKDEDFDVRCHASNALSEQGQLPPTAVEALLQLLKNEDFDVRSQAAYALSQQRQLPPTAVEALLQLLKDKDSDIRCRASCALSKQSQVLPIVVKVLVQLLQDEDSKIRSHASYTLSEQDQLPPTAVEALLQLLKNEDFDVRSQAVYALSQQRQLPPTAVEALLQLHKDKDPAIRYRATYALSRQIQLPPMVVEALVQVLKDKDQDSDIRSDTAFALSKQSQLPPTAVEALVQLLGDEDPTIRFHTADFLSRQSQVLPIVVEVLVQLVKGSDVAFWATDTLCRQSLLSPKVLKTLLSLSPQAILKLPISDMFHDREELYALLPSLDVTLTQNLWMIWMQLSFARHIACYSEGQSVHIHVEGRPVRKTLLRNDQIEALRSLHSKLSKK